MSQAKHPSRIVWAVDALTEDKPLFQKTVKALQAWARETRVEIEPVYVLSPDQMYVPQDLFGSIQQQVEESTFDRLKKLLGKVKIPGLKEARVLTSPNYSLRSAVHELVTHAKRSRADMIVASTLSKKGMTRFLFGSFAESLVLQSEIPVFLVSPKTEPVKSFRRIFFPTDLTPKSMEVFESVLALAEQHQARITVFHKIEYLTDVSAEVFASKVYEQYLAADLARRGVELDKLAERARARGLHVNIVTDEKVASIVDAIQRAAKREKADLIALASQTGPVVTALLGSVTRQLIRVSQFPVWVVHPTDGAETINPHRPNASVPNDATAPSATRAARLSK